MIPNGAFEQEGFAGDGGASLRLGQRERYEELFAFADECSRLTMKVAALLPDATTKRQFVVSLFFARCTSHYQAAMNLAEGGMTVESLVLSRGLVETFFVLAAIAEDAVTPEELVGHDNASRVKHANALLNSSKYPNVAPFKETLTEFVTQNAGVSAIDMREFARRGEALAVYDGLYRHLSHHAAHPSLSAVDVYIADGESGRPTARYQPILGYTPRAVLSACAGILLACFACDRTGVRTPDTNAAGARLWTAYEQLYALFQPWE